MPTVYVPRAFVYVLGGMLSTIWVATYQDLLVMRYRKSAGIEQPRMFADKSEVEASPAANKFNLAQRTHQYSLRTLPTLLITALLTGLDSPVWAIIGSFTWSISSAVYTHGYVVTGKSTKKTYVAGLLTTLILIAFLCNASYYVVLRMILGDF
ncbi:hypothetical protein PTI98_001034 [Pleurotus ostreatus]|uniref:Uncharacterized protein n=1 Tax=Pleurotus ostreatus (strain PC15) TaxID=1137138 RepID=A0A067NSY6_PLEO1|nr:hypothetical protein PTI98_001034 [Pleurotus ostreatus]KDQ31039.1 hypothetical protein PLEOSDRAFT_1088629 [Pleurotus ostreatus PC15]